MKLLFLIKAGKMPDKKPDMWYHYNGGSMLKVATVFSGIGSPEWALKRIGISYEIVFACDNGERELKISKDEIEKEIQKLDKKERKYYIDNLYDKTGKQNYMQQK